MYTLKILALVLISVTAFLILIFAFCDKKPFRALFLNLLFGIVTLAVIKLTAKFTGIYIPINYYTVIGSSVFGIPAISAFLLLNIIFI